MNTLIRYIVTKISDENLRIGLHLSLIAYKKRGTPKYKYSSIDFCGFRKELDELKEICEIRKWAILEEWFMWNVDYVEAHEINRELNNYHRYCKENNIQISSPHVQESILRDAYNGYKNIALNYED